MRSTGLLLLLSIVADAGSTQEKGHIQVKSESGVLIFLDGTFKGETTSDLGGLVLRNVSSGKHVLKAVRNGFLPQEATITVTSGKVYVHTLVAFVPKITITQEGDITKEGVIHKTGALIVRSLPIRCKILCKAFGMNAVAKTKARWRAEGIPEGDYVVTFSSLGKTLSRRVSVRSGEEFELFVNFVTGKIDDVRDVFTLVTQIKQWPRAQSYAMPRPWRLPRNPFLAKNRKDLEVFRSWFRAWKLPSLQNVRKGYVALLNSVAVMALVSSDADKLETAFRKPGRFERQWVYRKGNTLVLLWEKRRAERRLFVEAVNVLQERLGLPKTKVK